MSNNRNILKAARKLGLCRAGAIDLRGKNLTELSEMYIKYIDFCLSNDFPSVEMIENNADIKTALKGVNVFCNEKTDIQTVAKCVCLGKCSGKIEIRGFEVCEIFVKHSSELQVAAHGNSFVMIDVFDDAKITLAATGDAKICINKYGNASVEYSLEDYSTLKVTEKHKKTY